MLTIVMNSHTKIHPTLHRQTVKMPLLLVSTVARIEIYAIPCNCTITVIFNNKLIFAVILPYREAVIDTFKMR